MKRRSFIAGMLAAPIAAQLPPVFPHMPAAPSAKQYVFKRVSMGFTLTPAAMARHAAALTDAVVFGHGSVSISDDDFEIGKDA